VITSMVKNWVFSARSMAVNEVVVERYLVRIKRMKFCTCVSIVVSKSMPSRPVYYGKLIS